MILFSFPAFDEIARELRRAASVSKGRFVIGRYDNQELNVRVEGTVSGEHCVILGTIAPPDESLLSVTLLAQTLKKEGADKITALLPYLAYGRQDKDKPGEGLGTAWVGALLKSSGISQVQTLDVHSERDRELFAIPLSSLSTGALFAEAMQKYELMDAMVAAPDNGAIGRCEAVKRAAGIPIGEIPYFEKKRTDRGIVHHGPIGRVGTRAVLVDDMIDTGGTLVSACDKLNATGVREIYVFVTHGLFTGTSWMKLWPLGVRRIFCTDTIPLRPEIDATNIIVLPIAPLLRQGLLAYGDERTVAT